MTGSTTIAIVDDSSNFLSNDAGIIGCMTSGASTTASEVSSVSDGSDASDCEMPDISVIAFSGPKRVGKSTAATALKAALEQRGISVKILSFAGPLKKIAMEFGFSKSSLYGSEAEKEAVVPNLGLSGRKFMQQLGTNLMREHFSTCIPDYKMVDGCNIWSTMLYRKLQGLPDGTVVIVDDLRFPGEAKMLKEAGATIVSLSGGNSKSPTAGETVHSSEQYFDLIEKEYAQYHVQNNLTEKFADRIVSSFMPVVAGARANGRLKALWEHAPAESEPLLKLPENEFIVLNPTFPDVHELAAKQIGGMWHASEFSFESDAVEFLKDDSRSQNVIAHVLGFFNVADRIISNHYCSGSIIERLGHHPEILKFGYAQGAIEEEHSEAYSNATKTILSSKYYDQVMIKFAIKQDCIGRKIDYMKTYLTPDAPISQTLFCDALLEGIGFAASFNVVFWLGNNNRYKQLVSVNNPISRDEGLHAAAAVCMYNKVVDRLSVEEATDICKKFTEAEIEFADQIYNGDNIVTGEKYDRNTEPAILKGMPLKTTISYIKYLANLYMVHMGYPKPYPEAPEKSPCPHMSQTELESNVNTFERTSGDYKATAPPRGTEEEQAAAFMGALHKQFGAAALHTEISS
ncbi:MAG: hypothetical protein CMK92_05360 [Pseudomonas sp.]|nr:hypothetical protein [Pseudomonas sp.]